MTEVLDVTVTPASTVVETTVSMGVTDDVVAGLIAVETSRAVSAEALLAPSQSGVLSSSGITGAWSLN